jgi:hypothetical protein
VEPAHVEPNLRSILEPDEEVTVRAWATEAVLAVTPRRLVVADTRRVALAVPFERLRRIQFDIERTRPATLVIVPERPSEQPQVLAFRPEDYRAVAEALVTIGTALAATESEADEPPQLLGQEPVPPGPSARAQ